MRVDLDALRALDAKATPGPWEASIKGGEGWPTSPSGPLAVGYEGEMMEADVNLIVALRNAAPELLRLARAARRNGKKGGRPPKKRETR